MATLIHILSKTGSTLRIAAYYPVPENTYDSASADSSRQPMSNRLTTQETTDLKNGRLFEWVFNYDTSGRSEAQIKADLESGYTQNQGAAMARYKRIYTDYVGEAFDGTSWS